MRLPALLLLLAFLVHLARNIADKYSRDIPTPICLATGTFRAKRDANQKLKACCARQKAADKDCKRRFCDFNSIKQDNMLHFLNTCTPRNHTVGLMWDCASSRVDHSECCKKKWVYGNKLNWCREILNFSLENNGVLPGCMDYCKTTKEVPADYLNHLVCLNNFNAIRNCFRDHLDKFPNIYGDV